MAGGDVWDEKYRSGEHLQDEPAALLARTAESLIPGSALDIACGPGRHALFLAERGWSVTAVDASRVAIEILQTRAKERSLTVDTRIADLEKGEFEIEPDSYDLICDCDYLQRDLFPKIRAGVRAGGLVIAAIPMFDEDRNLRSMNPAYLLNSGELRAFFGGWTILHYEEGKPDGSVHRRRVAELVARRE